MPRGDEERNKTVRPLFRPAEKQAVELAAFERQMTASDFIRLVALMSISRPVDTTRPNRRPYKVPEPATREELVARAQSESNRSENVNCRLYPDEKEAIDDTARQLGMTVSDFLRHVALKSIKWEGSIDGSTSTRGAGDGISASQPKEG